MALAYDSRKILESQTLKWDNQAGHPFATSRTWMQGGLMLATRNRFARNPYFHFHPLHTAFSLLAALILFGMVIWFLAVPAH
jgi:hypothetical protein